MKIDFNILRVLCRVIYVLSVKLEDSPAKGKFNTKIAVKTKVIFLPVACACFFGYRIRAIIILRTL